MKERPIILRADEIRAVLATGKAQIRRPIKRGQVFRFCREGDGPCDLNAAERRAINAEPFRWEPENPAHPSPSELLTLCPFGAPGDRLWVRETWRPSWHEEEYACIEYRADGKKLKPTIYDEGVGFHFFGECDESKPSDPWRSAMFMPRWASRITLEIVSVRVERVQSITEEDAIAEGVDAVSMADVPRQATMSRRGDFAQLWDHLYAKTAHAWALNPWVWVVEFRRVNEARED